MLREWAMAGLLCITGVVNAAELAGATLPDEAVVGGESLQLNGLGLREKFFVDVYVGGLYLPKKATSTKAVFAMSGPRRILLHFVYGEISRKKLVEAWREGFEANLTSEEKSNFSFKIKHFYKLFSNVKQGDEISLDHMPGTGTRVLYNGELQGTVAGRAFAQAWLKILIGKSPADSDLKAGMLGDY